MRLNAFKVSRLPYTCDLHDYVEPGQTDADGNLIKFYYKRTELDFDLQVDLDSPRIKLLTEVPVDAQTRLVDLRFKDGTPLLPEGSFYTVVGVVPFINAIGQQDGYVIRAVQTYLGEDFTYEEELPAPVV